jgi:virginiamycin B lyase
VTAVGLLAGCTGTPAPGRFIGKAGFALAKTINLPAGEFPSFLAFGVHHTLWVTETDGNVIASVGATGAINQLPIESGTNNSPQDIISVPGGSIWFTGSAEIGRITPDGDMTVWRETSIGSSVGAPDALTVGPGGQIWYTDDAGFVCRLISGGKGTCFPIHPTTKDIWMRGLATGSDGALWFTEDNLTTVADTQNAIGRVTTAGKYRQWLLPPGSGPTRIAAGPDGALWFTERGGQRIGRITTSGVITQFPLPRGVYPFDIVSGPDKALWFTTDTRVGRITTSGQITLWPVPGAQQLGGITVAPDGTLWLADGVGNTIRQFVPTRKASLRISASSPCFSPAMAFRSAASRRRPLPR